MSGAALGDRFGRRRLFVTGLAVFTVASAAAALAPGIDALIAARAVQGVGAAIMMPLTLTLLTAAVPAARRGMAYGLWGAVNGLAIASGPLIGGGPGMPMIVAPVAGYLSDRIGGRPVVAAGLALQPSASGGSRSSSRRACPTRPSCPR